MELEKESLPCPMSRRDDPETDLFHYNLGLESVALLFATVKLRLQHTVTKQF